MITAEQREQLFADFGVLAYTIIYDTEAQEREYEEELAWQSVKPLRDTEQAEESDWLDCPDEDLTD